MKNILFIRRSLGVLAVTLFLLTSFARAQQPQVLKPYPTIHGIDTSEQVRLTDTTWHRLKNNISSFAQTQKGNDTTGYYTELMQGSEIKIIITEMIDNTAPGVQLNKRTNWYFNNGQPVYADFGWYSPADNKLMAAQKAYLYNGHLIALHNFNKNINSSGTEFSNAALFIESYAATLTNYAQKLKAGK